MITESVESTEDRPVWGVPAIATIIDRTHRQTYYLLKQGRLDAAKVGKLWVSTRKRLKRSILPEAA